jgi:signal peptidase II
VTQGLRRTLAIAAALFVVDRLVKLWVVVWLDLANRGAIDVLPPVLNLRMAWNRGINFGLLASDAALGRWLLVAVAVAVSLGIAVWVRRAAGWAVPVLAGAIIGGALGNALDRVIWGAVADFLNMSCCGIANPYSFNVADIAIFAGAIGLIVRPQRGAGPAPADSGRDGGRPLK